MTIKIENVAQPTGELRKVLGIGELPWYKWRVWVDEDPAILNQIESVEYILHPTFPQPRRVSDDRAHNFELVSGGWREFWIEATIVFKDLHEEKISYKLDFNKQGEVPIEHLISALKDENPDLRWRAATVLGDIGDAKAVEPLVKALEDNYEPARFAAEEALARIGDKAVEPLIDALKNAHPFVRGGAAKVLGTIASAKAIGPLTVISKNDGFPVVRGFAKDALKSITTKQKLKIV
jgi:hypothetical protein